MASATPPVVCLPFHLASNRTPQLLNPGISIGPFNRLFSYLPATLSKASQA
ncbi:MAG: hypothetical protein ABIJ50_09025 [Pseudomonadota bacterium]